MAIHCTYLTLSCIGNQHLYLQHNAASFILASGGNMDQLGHLPPQICIESYSVVYLCSVFYLKAYLHHIEPFRKKSDGPRVCSLFLVIIGGTFLQPLCDKLIFSWVRNIFSIAEAPVSWYPPWSCSVDSLCFPGVHPAGM